MITVTEDRFPLAQAFTISRGSKTEARVLTVRLSRGGGGLWAEAHGWPLVIKFR
jgi:L-Ala-D/L-Glu epimerase